MLHGNLRKLGFQLGTDEPQSAIIAVIMPDLERGAAMWERCCAKGFTSTWQDRRQRPRT